jgi:effector-binding domain-containing protein
MSEGAFEVAEVAPRPIAVMRAETKWDELAPTIRRLFDEVWKAMRTEASPPGAPRLSHDTFGENVIVYLDRQPTIEVGVLVEADFAPFDGLEPSTLPGGRIARGIHRGGYDRLGPTYDALHKWCADNGHIPTGVGWEHYGHWHEDPEQLETMIALVLQP